MTQPAVPPTAVPAGPVVPSPRLPRAQLLTLYRTLAGVQVVWNTGNRPLLGYRPGTERAWALLGIQGIQQLGTDELRYTWNAKENRNDEVLVGQRTFTASFQAFSIDAELEAYDLCERVRFRMRTQTARALMVPFLALRDFQNIQQPPPEQMQVAAGGPAHIVLRATMDVRMLAVVGDGPNDAGGGGVIATAPVPTPVYGGNLKP